MCWVSEINLVSGELFFDFQEFTDLRSSQTMARSVWRQRIWPLVSCRCKLDIAIIVQNERVR